MSNKLLKYIRTNWIWILLLLLSLTPIIWFWGKNGTLINGLDTNFPLDPLVWFKRRFYVWYDISNAGSNFSSSISGLFFHLIQVAPYILGLSLQRVEIINLVFWYSLIIFSSFVSVKSFGVKSKLAQLIFVTIYSFNIYLFNTWENVKVSNLALYVTLPSFIALLNFYLSKNINIFRLFLYSFLISIIASGTGINPAYFLVIIIGIIIFTFTNLLFSKKLWIDVIKSTSIVIATLVLTNLYWILPLFNNLFISSKISNLSDIGLTDWLDSLSLNTSLLNVLRLQGAWDWFSFDSAGQPLYLPYTLNYLYKLPFILFSFVLPSIAILSFVFIKNKDKLQNYLLFGIFLVVGIFMGAGTHYPTGVIYRFLVDKVPFFSFFRSPWYIFTPLLIFAYAGLSALFFDNVTNILYKSKRIYTNTFYVVGVVFIAFHLLYSYPLISGKIFRPLRHDGFFVNFPDYVWEAQNWIESTDLIKGRIITYPDDQIEDFDWGYRGTDTILALFSSKEFFTPSFNISSQVLKDLLDEFYLAIKSGNYDSAVNIMKYIGADTVFNRKDFVSISPKLDENSFVREYTTETKEIGRWSFINIKDNANNSKIFSPERTYINNFSDKLFLDFAKISPRGRELIAKLPDSEFSKTIIEDNNYLHVAEAIHNTEEVTSTSNIQFYTLEIAQSGSYKIYIEKAKFGTNIIINNISYSGQVSQENSNYLQFNPDWLNKGIYQIKVVFPKIESLVDIISYQKLSPGNLLRPDELPVNPTKTLVAFSDSKVEEKITIPIKDFDPFDKYLLSFDYKYFYGKIPVVDVVQSIPTSPVKTFPDYVGSSFDWERKTITINPVDLKSKLEATIILPKNEKRERSKTFFENFELLPVFDNRLVALQEPREDILNVTSPKVSFTKISPVKYNIEVEGGTEDYYLVFLENYNPGWKLILDDTKGEIVHFKTNGFANGWYVSGGEALQKITLFYQPQIYLYIGFTIFILIGFISIYLLITKKYDNI
ncbi:MAG: hypothetical protein ACD_26C00034G0029 [uncultured bacterium]|nr:MAG: hypothetical protein ACD_26C00034G0029 [uncultured bacterium]